MSVVSNNSPTSSPDAVEIPDDPGSVFGAVIERNECVCRHCYRRLKRKEPYPHSAGDDHGELVTWVTYDLPEDEPDWNTADREYFETPRIPDRNPKAYVPDEPAADAETRHCWNCGTTEPHRTPKTRSREEAVDVAANISVTLLEYDVAHDWVLLLERVDELKQQPDYAGDDFGAFGRAVAEAIDAVR